MKSYITLLGFLFSLTLVGQVTIKKSSIDSGGVLTQNSGLNMLYTIGEVAVQEQTIQSLSISEGFINKGMMTTVGLNEMAILKGVKAFPIPTKDLLTISFESRSEFEISIFDNTGKLIQSSCVEGTRAEFQLGHLSSGLYSVFIKDLSNNTFIGYKIIKE